MLVAETTSPDWEPVMKRAGAIVTNRGGRTCHAAIVARELGIPAVVGADGATEVLKPGALVTVSCAEGETGRVYAGAVPFDVSIVEPGSLARPHTEIMINLEIPISRSRRHCGPTTASAWPVWSSSSPSRSASIPWPWRTRRR